MKAWRALVVLAGLWLAGPASAWAERQWISDGPVPLRYEIAIDPDAAASAFAGDVRIRMRTDAPAAQVVLNAAELEVQSATIDGAAARVALDAAAQTLTLTPRRPLAVGEHEIHILYRGAIRDEAYGLFRTTYQADGAERVLLQTQFEPGDARRLAPLVDQPNRRAVFALTVTAPAADAVYSNMPVVETTRQRDGRVRTRFADTPSMASYLLFFAMGDLERISTNVDGIDVGVVTRRGAAERGRYALQTAADSLRYFQDYFGIRYPLPKLDLIGTPGAGGFGAMENWGAILFFDQYLLLDPQNSSEGDRRQVFVTVAHEIAHQWFGDLVTMNWWDDIWLNEGFASWMETKAAEHLHPDWRPWLAQLAEGTADAKSRDARAGTHPVIQQVDTLDQANLAFDTITYQKGQAVIRMIEAYVGEDAFRTGVRAYLNAHLYGNTESDDLWRAVQAASGQPVLDIARSFTMQPGYPVLRTAQTRCTRAAADDHVAVTQRRFALDDASRTQEIWSVPIVARPAHGEPIRAVLNTAERRLDLPACSPYLVNAGQSGFFRVLYGEFDALPAMFSGLDATDQLGLLTDYYAFGVSGDAEFASYLNLQARVQVSSDPIVALDTVQSLAALADYARGTAHESAVKTYVTGRLRPFLTRVGWTPRRGENINVAMLRTALIETLGELGDAQVAAEAGRRVRGSAANSALLPGAIREAAIIAYAANANAADYEALLAKARASTDFVEQEMLWPALGRVRDEMLARRTLQLVTGEDAPRQLRTRMISRVADLHPQLAWDFLREHQSLVESFSDTMQRLEFAGTLAGKLTDPASIPSVDAYAAASPEGSQPLFEAAKAQIRQHAQMAQERMPAVAAWIGAQRH